MRGLTVYPILQTIPKYMAKTDNTNTNNDSVDESANYPLCIQM